MAEADVRINGGFFVFRSNVFDAIEAREELMEGAMRRLVERDDLIVYRYDGFWAPMDTIKDKQDLDAIVESGSAPWLVAER